MPLGSRRPRRGCRVVDARGVWLRARTARSRPASLGTPLLLPALATPGTTTRPTGCCCAARALLAVPGRPGRHDRLGALGCDPARWFDPSGHEVLARGRGRGPGTPHAVFNHYAYGAVIDWVYRHVAGLAPTPSAPGYRRVLVAPRPIATAWTGRVRRSRRPTAGWRSTRRLEPRHRRRRRRAAVRDDRRVHRACHDGLGRDRRWPAHRPRRPPGPGHHTIVVTSAAIADPARSTPRQRKAHAGVSLGAAAQPKAQVVRQGSRGPARPGRVPVPAKRPRRPGLDPEALRRSRPRFRNSPRPSARPGRAGHEHGPRICAIGEEQQARRPHRRSRSVTGSPAAIRCGPARVPRRRRALGANRRWISIALSMAPTTDWNAAISPSPVCLTSDPPRRPQRPRTISSCVGDMSIARASPSLCVRFVDARCR